MRASGPRPLERGSTYAYSGTFTPHTSSCGSERFLSHSTRLTSCGRDDNILELIVHYDLDHETEEPFGPAQVLHVSEVGLPVEDVLAQVSLLREKLAIEPYGGLASEEFAFMGDIYGQLVVVKIGRPWQPAETLLAAVAPMQLTMSGKPEQQLQLSPFPYTFTVVL